MAPSGSALCILNYRKSVDNSHHFCWTMLNYWIIQYRRCKATASIDVGEGVKPSGATAWEVCKWFSSGREVRVREVYEKAMNYMALPLYVRSDGKILIMWSNRWMNMTLQSFNWRNSTADHDIFNLFQRLANAIIWTFTDPGTYIEINYDNHQFCLLLPFGWTPTSTLTYWPLATQQMRDYDSWTFGFEIEVQAERGYVEQWAGLNITYCCIMPKLKIRIQRNWWFVIDSAVIISSVLHVGQSTKYLFSLTWIVHSLKTTGMARE